MSLRTGGALHCLKENVFKNNRLDRRRAASLLSQPMKYRTGPIRGVIIRRLNKFQDKRGWLAELFRNDEMPRSMRPVMSYLSETKPGVGRGPHAHVKQTDYFCFIGPSHFKVTLWDSRKKSPTRGNRLSIAAGESSPLSVSVPPGVVHGYRNIGRKKGWVFNAANRLYRGRGKRGPVDEIRYEDDPASPFKF